MMKSSVHLWGYQQAPVGESLFAVSGWHFQLVTVSHHFNALLAQAASKPDQETSGPVRHVAGARVVRVGDPDQARFQRFVDHRRRLGCVF